MKKITQLLAKHPAILLLMLLTTLSFSSQAAVTCDVTETHGQGFTTSITDVVDNCDGTFTITLRVDHDGCGGPNCKELSHYAIEADNNTYGNVSVNVLSGGMSYSSNIDYGWNLGNTNFKGFKIDGISGIGNGMAGSFEVTYTLTGGLQDQQTKAKAGNASMYVSFSIADFESVMNCNGTGCGGPNAGLSGNVFHDINGLSDNTVNGTGIGQASSQTIYVHLLSFNTGTVLDVKAVNNDGTYSFDAAAGQYKVLISTTQGSVGSGAPQVNLPNGWVNTGEHVGAGTGSDNNPNGIVNATVVANQYTNNVNFGIEQRPVPENNTAASQQNPGGAINVEVPAATFEANDPDGIVTYIKITAFPSNANSININGNNYTSATFPADGVWVPTNSTGNPTQIILVDPVDGAVTVSIPFIAKDNAGIVSTTTGSANLPFTMPVLVGPTANDDNATTPINTPVDIDALQNDTPGDAALDPTSVTFIAGTEPNAATEGVFTVNATTGLVTFTPANNYVGVVTIDYEVCDQNALCDIATITVTIVDGNGNFYPAHGYGTLAYEDLWPAKGDYDFNDLVIDYQFEIEMNQANYINQVKATFIIRAFGASYENGFGFQLSPAIDANDLTVTGYSLTENFITLNANGTETGQSKATIIVYDNAYNEMQHPGVGIGVNTEPFAPYVQPATLTITIDFEPNKYTYNQLDIANFNPFIIVNKNRAVEVHLPNYPPTDLADQSMFGMWDDDSNTGTGKYYLTANNLPWAIHIYESFDYPIEKQDIIWVHLKFAEWATSGGILYPNWYKDLPGFRNDNLIYTPPSN